MIKNNLLTQWFVICIPISYEQIVKINNVEYTGIRIEQENILNIFHNSQRLVFSNEIFFPVRQEHRITIGLITPLISLQGIINDVHSNMARPDFSYQINFRFMDTYIMLNNLNSLIVSSKPIIELNSGGQEIKWELEFVINNPHNLAMDTKTGEYYTP